MKKDKLLSRLQSFILRVVVLILGRVGLYTIIGTGLSVSILSHMDYSTHYLEYIWYVELWLILVCCSVLCALNGNLSTDLLSYYEFQLLPYTIIGLLVFNDMYATSLYFTLLSYPIYIVRARMLEIRSKD